MSTATKTTTKKEFNLEQAFALWKRKSKDGKNNMLFIINFTPMERPDYRVGVPRKKTYKLVLNSEDPKFGGKNVDIPQSYKAVKAECDGRDYSFDFPLAPYQVAIFKY